jgi:hypothetical protein
MFIFKLRKHNGFHISAVALVSSYLFPRHQRVGCNDDFSSLVPLVFGVSQGSHISLLCFSLFIDDMTDALEFLKFHMFADDLLIYHSRPRDLLSECIREMICVKFLSTQ